MYCNQPLVPSAVLTCTHVDGRGADDPGKGARLSHLDMHYLLEHCLVDHRRRRRNFCRIGNGL